MNDDIVAVSSQAKRRCAADAAGAARNEHGAAIRLCSRRHHFLIGVFSNTEAGILASTVFEALEISGRRIEDIERCRPRRDAAGDAARPLNQHDFAVKLPESFIAFKFLLNSAEKLVARREERNGQRHSARAEKQTHNGRLASQALQPTGINADGLRHDFN